MANDRSEHPLKTEKTRSGREFSAALWAAVATVVLGFALNFLSEHRTEQLKFVDQQIEKLYGPLFALTQTRNAVMLQFQSRYWSDYLQAHHHVFFIDADPPSIEQVERWRVWHRTILQPINDKIEALITDNSELMVGESIPPAFMSEIEQTEIYRTVMKTWDDDKTGHKPVARTETANTSGVLVDRHLMDCVSDQYRTLVKVKISLENNPIGFFVEPLARSRRCDLQVGK